MKELLVISGKGGTGKTSIVGALALLMEEKVLADCDVDAANLSLLLEAKEEEKYPFYGARLPIIDREKCVQCDLCLSRCPSGAIKDYQIEPLLCEGCLICYHSCNQGAISLKDRLCGYRYTSRTPYGPLIHAALGIAQENSGKLVTEVKKEARILAQEKGVPYLLVDGPPGCACPLIASLSLVDLALIVTEPTVAGIHDLERIKKVVDHFRVKSMVCINKYDLELDKSQQIDNYCLAEGLEIPARISFDPLITKAMGMGKPVNKVFPHSKVSKELQLLWDKLSQRLERGSI